LATRNDITTRILGTKKPVRRARARGHACLIQYSGDALGRRYYINGADVMVGRAKTAGINIADESVSRAHARFTTSDETVEVEDLGSSNGTWVNDRRIRSRTALHDGDLIRLGLVQLKFLGKDNVENIFHDKIYRMATVDAGTQLYNRKYLLEALDSEFKYSRAQSLPLAVIFYDLDHFKQINDLHGHVCGDFILRKCADVAKNCVRRDDVLARYGGEEFVVVLPQTDRATATRLAERIRKAIEGHRFLHEGSTLRQTVSMGVAEMTPAMHSCEALLEDADNKLYQAKDAGRNRIVS
jgi:diguanylate cyclase (GGDEF)-like protein